MRLRSSQRFSKIPELPPQRTRGQQQLHSRRTAIRSKHSQERGTVALKPSKSAARKKARSKQKETVVRPDQQHKERLKKVSQSAPVACAETKPRNGNFEEIQAQFSQNFINEKDGLDNDESEAFNSALAIHIPTGENMREFKRIDAWVTSVPELELLRPMSPPSKPPSPNALPSLHPGEGLLHPLSAPMQTARPRQTRLDLSKGNPPILFQYGPLLEGSASSPVTRVLGLLDLSKSHYSKSWMPQVLETHLGISDPSRAGVVDQDGQNGRPSQSIGENTEINHRSAEITQTSELSHSTALLRFFCEISSRSKQCIEEGNGDTVLSTLVCKLLEADHIMAIFSKSHITGIWANNVKHLSLNTDLLPRNQAGAMFWWSQVDLILTMDRIHPAFVTFTTALDSSNSSKIYLSPFAESSIQEPPLLLIACKCSGDPQETENQLAVAAAACLLAIDQQLFDGRGLLGESGMRPPNGRRGRTTRTAQAAAAEEAQEISLRRKCLMVLTVQITMGVWNWGVVYMDGQGKVIARNRPGDDAIGDMTKAEGVCRIATWVAAAKAWLESYWIPAMTEAIERRNSRLSPAGRA
ncbi:hypothetical protein BDZ91DRAFT_779142 [Kalaharituber pfeilii]|nr:hypothetical protein BDZ91DRAFT_779142 [Kalaharituber pfeilii]